MKQSHSRELSEIMHVQYYSVSNYIYKDLWSLDLTLWKTELCSWSLNILTCLLRSTLLISLSALDFIDFIPKCSHIALYFRKLLWLCHRHIHTKNNSLSKLTLRQNVLLLGLHGENLVTSRPFYSASSLFQINWSFHFPPKKLLKERWKLHYNGRSTSILHQKSRFTVLKAIAAVPCVQDVKYIIYNMHHIKNFTCILVNLIISFFFKQLVYIFFFILLDWRI